VSAVALVALVACAASQSPPTLKLAQDWATPGLAKPESVLPSADGTFLYVSNVAGEGEARDGNGFISRLSPEGGMLEREWARGLDAPKGMALAGGRLFVSDVAQLVELDAASGAILARHDAPGAVFLNDVAIAPDGAVLVSDSGSARIFAWHEGRMDTWLADARLDAANGLLPERARLVVTTMQGRLLAVDWDTHAIIELAHGLGQADGVVALGDGTYLVGEWPGRLFHVTATGAATTVLDTRADKRYLNDFLVVGNRLLVPNWEPGSLTAYRLDK
jgi:glucose/arabinose dehydrogenase